MTSYHEFRTLVRSGTLICDTWLMSDVTDGKSGGREKMSQLSFHLEVTCHFLSREEGSRERKEGTKGEDLG